MSRALGVKSAMNVLPTCVELTVWDRNHEHSYSNIEHIRKTGTSFDINTRLSVLSWELYDGMVTFEEAREKLVAISHTKPANKLAVLILASLANASFCRLFGGDWISMAIVLVATAVGFKVKQMMAEDSVDIRFIFICSSFISSVIGAAGYVFNIGSTPDIALGTSVLYLVPGIPYLNSMSDLLDGHYISFANRLLDAAVLTACLSAGLCGGFLVMNLRWF